MILPYWWEQFPERLKFELDSLEKSGIVFERDDELFKQGIYRLRLELEVLGERHEMFVTFPDLYPYFRFELEAPSLSLAHHQNPFEKNLCLIGRGTHNWDTSTSVAALLNAQLENVIRLGRSADRDAARGVEEEQAEPYSVYYPYSPSMVVLQGEQRIPEGHRTGTFVVSTDGPQGPPPRRLIHGALSEVRSSAGDVLMQNDGGLLEAFGGASLEGSWFLVDEPIPEPHPARFVGELFRRFPHARRAVVNKIDGGFVRLWAVVFPEEGSWRNENSTGWVIVSVFNKSRSKLQENGGSADRRRSRKNMRKTTRKGR